MKKTLLRLKKNYAYGIIDWELAKCGCHFYMTSGKIYEMNGIIADDYTLKGKIVRAHLDRFWNDW
jgi:hypothetical protein